MFVLHSILIRYVPFCQFCCSFSKSANCKDNAYLCAYDKRYCNEFDCLFLITYSRMVPLTALFLHWIVWWAQATNYSASEYARKIRIICTCFWFVCEMETKWQHNCIVIFVFSSFYHVWSTNMSIYLGWKQLLFCWRL